MGVLCTVTFYKPGQEGSLVVSEHVASIVQAPSINSLGIYNFIIMGNENPKPLLWNFSRLLWSLKGGPPWFAHHISNLSPCLSLNPKRDPLEMNEHILIGALLLYPSIPEVKQRSIRSEPSIVTQEKRKADPHFPYHINYFIFKSRKGHRSLHPRNPQNTK